MGNLIQGWGCGIPQDIHDKIAVTWGARAIYKNQIIDLPPERVTWTVPGQELNIENHKRLVNSLSQWINAKGLPFLRKEARTLYPDECRTVALDEGLYHIEASPQSSWGYLYIRAWKLRPQERVEPGTIAVDQTSKESIASELDRQS